MLVVLYYSQHLFFPFVRDLKLSSGKGHLVTLRLLQDKLKKVTEDLKKVEDSRGKLAAVSPANGCEYAQLPDPFK